VPNVSDLPLQQVATSVDEASRRAGRALDMRSASRFWWGEGLAFVRHEPRTAAWLTLRKAALFLRAEEIPLNIHYAFARRRLALLWPTVSFGLLLPLALAGGVGLWTHAPAPGRRGGVLLVTCAGLFAASVIAFFVSDRYRAPVVPLLAVLAAHGVVSLANAARTRSRTAWALLGTLAAAAVLVNAPFTDFRYPEYAKDYFELGRVYRDRGEFPAALEQYQKAVALSPDVPDAVVELATTYHAAGRPLEAEMALRRALAMAPDSAAARRNLALLYKEQGLLELALGVATDDAQRAALTRARDDLRHRISDAAAFGRAQYDAGVRLYGDRRLPEARYAFLRATAADPSRDAAYFALALVCKDLRLRDEACAAIEKASALAPADTEYASERAALCPRR